MISFRKPLKMEKESVKVCFCHGFTYVYKCMSKEMRYFYRNQLENDTTC